MAMLYKGWRGAVGCTPDL